MKRFFLLVAVCFVGYIGHSQVGIGNTDPKSSLDISATNTATPSNTDGILVPRIDNFPTPDPGADQDGMLVFVTGNGTPSEGFYYWDNGTTSWILVNGAGNDADWFITGTTNPSSAITDNLVTQGSVTIGTDLNGFPNTKLFVKSDVTSDTFPIRWGPEGTPGSSANIYGYYSTDASLTPSSGFNYMPLYNNFTSTHLGSATGLYNNFNGSGGAESGVFNRFNNVSGVYGMRNEFVGTTSSNSVFIGMENRLLSSATYDGIIYGLNNNIQAAGNGTRYGLFNTISGTGTGTKYGSYTNISSSAGGTHYGIYSDVQSASGFAGYFVGRTSFGTDPTTGRYLLPAADGNAGQVLTTDGSGQLGFTDPVSEDVDWYEVGTTSAPNAISDDMFTQGNVVIGATTNPANVKFYVESDPASNTTGIRQTMSAATSGLLRGIDNTITANGTTNVYALSNSIAGNSTGLSIQAIRNSFSGSGGRKTGMFNSFSFGFGGDARGVENDFNNSAITSAFGSYNSFTNLNASASAYGMFNTASGSTNATNLYGSRTIFSGSTVSGSAYGEYSFIQTSGTDYGIYAQVDNNAIDYAAYFVGRASFGTDSAVGRYLLPAADGTTGQVIATNGSGQLGFIDAVDTQNSLDGAYDEGGAGNGRIINADVGSVEIVATGSTGIAQVITHNAAGSGLQLNLNGNLNAMGTNTPGLEINNSLNTNAAFSNTYGIYNKMISNGTSVDGTNYGIRNWFQPAGSSAGTLYSFHSDVQNTGNGDHYSYYSRMNSAGTGNKFGLYSVIVPTSGGTHYGLYSEATKAGSFAAYLLGTVSIGTNSANTYVLPSSRGTNNQVMQINGTGTVSWADPSAVFTDTDDQTIDTLGLVGNTLGLSLENDGQPVQTVDLSNVNFNVSNFALAKMTMSSAQTLTGPAWTKQNFDTVSFDLGSNFNTTNDRFEVSEDGYYRIEATSRTSASNATTNQFGVAVRINGSAVKQSVFSHHGTGVIAREIETVEFLSSGDYVEIFFYTESNIGLGSSSLYSTFEVERIR